MVLGSSRLNHRIRYAVPSGQTRLEHFRRPVAANVPSLRDVPQSSTPFPLLKNVPEHFLNAAQVIGDIVTNYLRRFYFWCKLEGLL
jgi:hypothetical protein